MRPNDSSSGDLPQIIPIPNKRIKDLSRHRFGRLLVLGYTDNGGRKYHRWLCQCDCGNLTVVIGSNLTTGQVQSCRCLIADSNRKTKKLHGKRGTPEHRVWVAMNGRCTNKNISSYNRYGGRGITVCAHWRQSFTNFLTDMKARPGLDYSIDRIDTDGHYSCGHCDQCKQENWPANCRWATEVEQANNKSNNRFLEFDGERMTIAKWAKKMKISPQTLYSRLRYGWTIEDALTRSVRPY